MKSGFVLLVAVLLMLSGCGGDSGTNGDSAHINEESGSVNEAVPDERVGTTPPRPKGVKLAKAADVAGCYLLRNVPPENVKVIPFATPVARYSKNPPMFGPHTGPSRQQADGAYLTLPNVPATVASLNQGRMLIQYAPDLPEEFQLQLKGLFDSMYGGTLFFPNSTMNYAVTATTWGNLLGCTGYEGAATLEAIRAFGKATWGKYGNVPVDKYPVEGPTPVDPEEPGKAKAE